VKEYPNIPGFPTEILVWEGEDKIWLAM